MSENLILFDYLISDENEIFRHHEQSCPISVEQIRFSRIMGKKRISLFSLKGKMNTFT